MGVGEPHMAHPSRRQSTNVAGDYSGGRACVLCTQVVPAWCRVVPLAVDRVASPFTRLALARQGGFRRRERKAADSIWLSPVMTVAETGPWLMQRGMYLTVPSGPVPILQQWS